MYLEKDIQQFEQKGINPELIDYQIMNFKKGFPFIDLDRPATPGDGISSFNDDQLDKLIRLYEEKSGRLHMIKFVPASGAATRMFKNLFQFTSEYKHDQKEYDRFIADKSFNSIYHFISSIANFAFYQDLHATLQEKGLDIEQLLHDKDYGLVIENVLNSDGLDYGRQPKGLILFHQYDDGPRYAFEEHLVEGALYCKQSDGQVYIHLTVSPEHQEGFQQLVDLLKTKYEEEFGIKYHVSFSEQKSSTDTIAVDLDNEPFRNDDDSILFRPGGHGALIENLNDLDADVIYIKNIDNIVPDRLKEDTITYKKVIGGLMLQVQEKTFEYLRKLEDPVSPELISEIRKFAQDELNIILDDGFGGLDPGKQQELLKMRLNRPVRVCGMVKNEGEPGGGPFWVRNQQGEVSLQIVEGSQINPGDQKQQDILQAATHFNPVDLVCGIKDYRGNKFDLHDYIDSSTGFISIKSKDGRDLKAQELPGLWNGAMAGWNTIFVEVPIITFNPVKIVNDLLRETHQ